LAIVVGGIVLAAMIGRRDPSGESGLRAPDEAVMLRRRAGPADDPAPPVRREAPVASVTRFSGPRNGAAVVPAEKPDVLPPALAKSFPDVDPPATARWGTSMGIRLAEPTSAAEAVSVHKIVDGDTLSTLALQYLGSGERAREIYEANRDLLTSPEALPIGLELRIPRRNLVNPPQGPVPRPTLVPVPSRSTK
jgi:nucleoid-associated protein YgaU